MPVSRTLFCQSLIDHDMRILQKMSCKESVCGWHAKPRKGYLQENFNSHQYLHIWLGTYGMVNSTINSRIHISWWTVCKWWISKSLQGHQQNSWIQLSNMGCKELPKEYLRWNSSHRSNSRGLYKGSTDALSGRKLCNNNNHLFVPRKDRNNYNLYFIKVEGTACPK